ncbi:MAG: hypothetical protein JOZ70_03730 [Pseudolabrys sp.]|nr:hypothetical protein [Pseudolabrys sp.]MBV9954341.1 hypothetical protein [Pseudolabrys sp.]
MSRLSEFFGRKGGSDNGASTNGKHGHEPITLEQPAEVGSRMGEENEVLRHLLSDTGRKIGALDELKDAFDKIVTPFNNTLRALEQEKSQNLSLRGLLAENRSAYESLRTKFYELEKKATAQEAENDRLREDLELSRETLRGLESARSELNNRIASQNAQLGDLERQLATESTQRRSLSESNRVLNDQLDASEKRSLGIESELAAARERIALLEQDRATANAALEQAVNESARLNRRFTESEAALAMARTQLAKLEANFAEAHAERTHLAAALEETKEKHAVEANGLQVRLDALQSRAATAERLLAETRQNLIARTEEARAFDRKATEATIARHSAEKRLSQIEGLHEARERQIKDLEHSRLALVERSNSLTKTLKLRETGLARAEEKIQTLTERSGRLEADIQIGRTNVEKRVEDLTASLQRERMERAVVEGALEAARKDNSRLQSEIGGLRAAVRRGAAPDESAAEPAKPRRGKAGADIEPIIKS